MLTFEISRIRDVILGHQEVLADGQPAEAEPVGQGRDLADPGAADLVLPRLQQGRHPVVVRDREADPHQAGTPLVVEASRPPASTFSCMPVTQRDSSEARKTTASLMSDGWM
jgi:hypothetical protein